MKPFSFLNIVAALFVTVLLAEACSPFTKISGDDDTISKLDGSWTVKWSGDAKLEGVSPEPTLVFDTKTGTISGFDGCNRFKGTYTFENERLRATVAKTRNACPNDAALGVSKEIDDLFSNGAQVVEASMMGTHVLSLKNSSAEIRVAPMQGAATS